MLLLISTSHALSFSDEFIEDVNQCKNGNTELCLKMAREIEALEKNSNRREMLQEVYSAWEFYAHACMQWSFEGCIGAIRTYE